MYAASAAFLAAIRESQTLATRATLTPTSGAPIDLPLEDGTVTIDRTADHRRRCDIQIADATLYPDSTSDPVNVYGATVRLYRGVDFGGGRQELAPLGKFRLEDAGREIPAGALGITGWDASRQVLDTRFAKPRTFPSTGAIALIEQLILEVDPTAAFDVTVSDTTTTIPKHVVDRDRWPEINRIAALLGAEVFPDATGRWQIRDVPNPQTAQAVWEINAGEGGVLVGASNRVTREGAPNQVVAIGESLDGNSDPVYGSAVDSNPLSPTLWGGPYGKVPRFYSSPHLRTVAQANRAAAAMLADHLGVSRSVSFTAVPNPALEAGDAVGITYPDGTREVHLADTLTIGLGPSAPMTGETRARDWDAA